MKGNHTASGNVYYLDSHFPYPQFNRTKRIWIYLPADYFSSTNSTYSVVYMSDGQNVFDVFYNPGGREWGVDETLEHFYEQGFETSIVVGVETEGSGLKGQRVVELTPWPNEVLGGEGGGGDLFLDFLINNVKPYIDDKFRTKPDRFNTALIGSSLGGLFNIYAGLKFQPVFGKIGSFSPAFIFNPQIYDFASNQTQMFDDFKVYFVCGAKEWLITVVPDMLRMYSVLAEKGYENLNYAINPNGEHNEDLWKVEFPDAYKWIFNLP
jgi:predicted alpha/beta superfamily hydrolase